MKSTVFTGFSLILVVYSCLLGLAESSCGVHPKFWCDDEDIARRCEVYDQCSKYVWADRGLDLHFDPELFRPSKRFLKDEVTNAPLVDFALYYEVLCPDCREFFKYQLYPTFKAVGSVMNLTLVPYGNAKEQKVGSKWVFKCQHGEQECLGNVIDTCAIHIVKNISVYMPYIHCMEGSAGDVETAAKDCAKEFPVPLDKILKCAKSDEGNALEHQMAQMTDALVPSHQYVPWVTLFGKHTEEIQKKAQDNLLKLVCDSYTGPKPSAC